VDVTADDCAARLDAARDETAPTELLMGRAELRAAMGVELAARELVIDDENRLLLDELGEQQWVRSQPVS
jgi:hypothetical protein